MYKRNIVCMGHEEGSERVLTQGHKKQGKMDVHILIVLMILWIYR